MYIVVALIVLYLAYVFISASRIAEVASHPKANSYEEEITILRGFGYDCKAFTDEFPCESLTCKSEFGYDIHARIFRHENSDRAVLLCHGYGGNSTTMLSYARVFRNLGFSVVVYDHRNFGLNERTFTSFGFYESKDLKTVFDYVKDLFEPSVRWGIMGESMGAATVMMALPNLENVCFSVIDCGYSKMKDEISIIDPLPSLGSVQLSNLFFKKRYGYTMDQVQPCKELEKVDENFPMLFVYSKTDKTVPFYMFDEVFNAKKGKKTSWIVEDCRHAKVIFNFTEEYQKRVAGFLEGLL